MPRSLIERLYGSFDTILDLGFEVAKQRADNIGGYIDCFVDTILPEHANYRTFTVTPLEPEARAYACFNTGVLYTLLKQACYKESRLDEGRLSLVEPEVPTGVIIALKREFTEADMASVREFYRIEKNRLGIDRALCITVPNCAVVQKLENV